MIVLVSGPSGSGKTRFCEAMIGTATDVAGILCPGIEVDGERTEIRARTLPGVATRILATRRDLMESDGELVTPRWRFDPATVAWGDAHLASIGRVRLLVVDELGPLEFERREGFVSAFPLLDRGAFALALVVVRPGLLPLAQSRWPGASVHDVTGAGSRAIPIPAWPGG